MEPIRNMGRKCKFFEKCHQSAVFRIPHSNLALCKQHFLENVEKRVKKLVEKKHMFHPNRGEKLLIAASGGKDSQVLISIIKTLYPENLDIEALYIELGIKSDNYSVDSGKIAKDWCKNFDIPFHTLNIKKDYGINIDDLHNLRELYKKSHWQYDLQAFRGECSYCGSYKRYNINKFAYEHSFTAVATGHNLTDEATSLLNNFLNQNLMFLSRPGPKSNSKSKFLIPRVKPLFFISELEITMYAYYKNIPYLPTECPYARQSPVNKLKGVLLEIEEYRKGNMIAYTRGFYKKLQPVINKAYQSQIKPEQSEHLCSQCGRPTFGKICSFCKTQRYLHKQFRKVDEKLHIDLIHHRNNNKQNIQEIH
ncbi:ATP-binding protein [Candidatus Harpocratesius sp.]